MPDISTIADGFALGKSVFDLLRYVKSTAGADVVSGYFSHDGTRLVGSELIEIEREWPDKEKASNVFFFRVGPIADYVFLRYPVVESCAHELVGTGSVEDQPTAEYWRWIAPVLPGRIYGGGDPPNLKVPFLVFGYKPKALILQFSTKT
jgi:hypothetical protein